MDASGKIIWARHNEVQTVNVKSLGSDYELTDGERLPLAVKDLGACDLYPQVRCRAGGGVGTRVCKSHLCSQVTLMFTSHTCIQGRAGGGYAGNRLNRHVDASDMRPYS
jgi:hypothetical protein